jgi:outer membrane protein TolC
LRIAAGFFIFHEFLTGIILGDNVTRFYTLAITGILILIFPFYAMADSPGSMTLDQCLAYGYEHNPTLKSADFQVAAAQDGKNAVRADFMPSVSTSYGFSRLDSESAKGPTEQDYLNQYIRSFSVRVSQVLFAGFRITHSHDKAKIDVERTRADRDLARLELTYQIQAVFFQLMKAKEDLTIARESIERLEQGLKSAEAYFDRQLISRSEVLTARVDLADAQQQASIAANEVNRKRIALFSLMNMPMTEDVRFTGGLDFFNGRYPDKFDPCWQTAQNNRPDIESLEKQVAMMEKDAAIAAGTYLPQIRLEVGYYDQDRNYDEMAASFSGPVDRDQRNRYWSAGVTASWELFDGGRAWYQRNKSLNQVFQIKEKIKEIQLFIREGIRKALFSIAEARDRTEAAKVAVTAARENYDMELRRLDAGLTTIPLLLDAQFRLARAQGNLTRAMLDYQLGRAELGFMMGEMD